MKCKACGKAEKFHVLASVRARCPEYNGDKLTQQASLQARADILEGWARDRALPEQLRKDMMSVAWDMKTLFRNTNYARLK